MVIDLGLIKTWQLLLIQLVKQHIGSKFSSAIIFVFIVLSTSGIS